MASLVVRHKPVLHLVVLASPKDKQVVLSRAKYLSKSITYLASRVDISRPYFYRSLDAGFELGKFLKLQAVLDLDLIDTQAIQSGASLLISEAQEIGNSIFSVPAL
jgi:hypothetical protein